MEGLIVIIVLLITSTICSIGWATCYISTKALLFFMKEKNYAPPDKAETKKWCKYAAKHTLGIQTEKLN